MNRQERKRILGFLCVMIVSLAMSSVGYSYASVRVYPAVVCFTPPDSSTFHDQDVYNGGVGPNDEFAAPIDYKTYYCPIPRHEYYEDPTNVRMYYRDKSYTKNVECTFYSTDEYGGTIHWSQQKTSSGVVNSYLEWPSITETSYDHFYLFCRVPEQYDGWNSRIMNIRVSV